MKNVILDPTNEQAELAWSRADTLPGTNSESSRYDRHGVLMQRDKLGDKSHDFGWIVVEDKDGNPEAINQFFRLPAKARATINILQHALGR